MPGKKPRPRILVVDDSTLVCKTIGSVLNSQGYEVSSATSGEEGLECLKRELPDAILCDIVMPGIDGYEFCRQVKARRRTRNIPVILLTSRSDPQDKVKGLDSGAADYVTKPFDAGELRARIAAHLRIVKLQEELRTRNRLLEDTRRQLEDKVEALSLAYQHLSDLQVKRQKALEMAYKVQLGLLPSSNPKIEGYGFGSGFLPAENIAGDFYDYIPLDRGRWGIAIGDVAGKGLPASLLMVLTKTLLRTEAMRESSPGRVLESVNRLIIASYGSAEAVTLFYGILDPASNSLTFSNGGHEFPIVCSTRRRTCVELTTGGTFLGIFPDARYNEARVFLTDEDLLLFYTDGLFHLQIGDRPLGSGTGLRDFLSECHEEDAEPLLAALLSAKPAPALGTDDVTVIAMRCRRPSDRRDLGYVDIYNTQSSLKDVRDFTRLVADQLELQATVAHELSYAVDEAVTNAVVHAYDGPNAGQVQVHFHFDPERRTLETAVVDHGRGVGPTALQDPLALLTANPLRPDGRGLLLMKSLTDRLELVPTEGGGTTVRMMRRI
ncbi:MAG: SpoIIE family protein phosphatase [Candidatus Riflebacteria bacterium]|nr:SpoIIE family protein phosphatase [Candidatus Riflebacteria bacterium]